MIPEHLTEPFLIVCEGKGDYEFLRHLIEARTLTGFQYAFPERTTNADGTVSGTYGKQGFADLLGGLAAFGRELLTLQAIVLVTDSDESPSRALAFAQNAIESAGHYDVPTALLTPSDRVDRFPPVIIVTLPSATEEGNLETLLLKAVPDNFQEAWTCLESYFQCARLPLNWSINKQSKMRLQCVVSIVCSNDPTCAVSSMWSSQNRVFRPMLEHECFNPLVEFLEGLPTLLQGE